MIVPGNAWPHNSWIEYQKMSCADIWVARWPLPQAERRPTARRWKAILEARMASCRFRGFRERRVASGVSREGEGHAHGMHAHPVARVGIAGAAVNEELGAADADPVVRDRSGETSLRDLSLQARRLGADRKSVV